MNRIDKIKSINRIQTPRNYTQNTLRLDMAERGCLFPKNFYKNFINNKLTELDFIAYPDYQRYFNFTNRIKDKFNFSQNSITLESGSDSLIKLVIQCFCPEDELIAVLNPSFPMYNIYGQSLGSNTLFIDFKNSTHIAVNDLISQLNDHVKILFISNPCSPFGNLYTDYEINEIIKFSELRNFIVCLDEAYVEFAPKTTHSKINYSKNLIRIRTFSKAIGAAGIRLGYAVASEEICQILRGAQLTFPITGPSLAFGEYILDNYDLIDSYIDQTKLTRDFICKTLKELNFDILGSHTNSIHIHAPKDKVTKVQNLIEAENVLVKAGSAIGVPVIIPNDERKTWIRMSVYAGLEKTDFFEKLISV